MYITTVLFDLDDTLYPASAHLWEIIRARMGDFIHERLGIPADQVNHLRKTYLDTYGTTLRGLQHNFDVDADDYLAFVHDIPLDQYLEPNPRLRSILLSLPQQRWIFTNADTAHAQRVLKVLNLYGCFHGIIDIRLLDFICKPAPQAYQRALEISGEPDPARCLLIDDAVRNLLPAQEMGFATALVGSEKHPAVQFYLQKINDLPGAIPELWKTNQSDYQ